MNSSLRARAGLIALLAAFAIPVGMSSLRGLTHLLTCREPAATHFTLIVPPAELGGPEVVSSQRIRKGEESGLCGGLFVDIGVRPAEKPELEIGISNRSDLSWKGSVAIAIAGETIPVGIGEIGPGSTETRTVGISLDPGEHELNGSLLLGP